MRTEATSVEYGRLPDNSTSDPYSLMPRAKLRAAPEVIAGANAGMIKVRNVVKRDAPSDAAASSTSGSSSASTGCTVRTTNGRVTKRNARKTAIRVLAQSTPSGLDGPYRLNNTMPATIVGRANG